MTICEPESGGDLLCIRLSGLGDIVHTLNALSLLREHRPLAHITWIVEERFAGLLEGHPYIDELITIPRRFWGHSLRRPMRWAEVLPEMMDLALSLRRRHFTASIDFQSSIKSGWLVGATGAALRVGFAPPVARELTHLVQNRLVRMPRRGCHRIERDLALLAPLGIPTRFAPAVLPCSNQFAGAAERVCAELPRPLVIMHPGTSEFAAFKRWEPERYAQVADQLMAERGACVLVTWGPGEEALALRVVGATGHRAVMAPRITHLQHLAHVLSQADLLISSDTGPMHMACALGRPVVALFGPKDPVETGPYCSRSEVVTAPVRCRPCTRRHCADRRCMQQIYPEQVYAAASALLDGGGRTRARSGLIRLPFSVGFELGRWRGEVCTGYSAPGFYRFLAEFAERPPGGDEKLPGRWAERVTSQVQGEARSLLVARRGPREGARRGPRSAIAAWMTRNHWRASLLLRRAGVPVRLPVCYLETGPVAAREQLLMVEDGSSAPCLAAALRSAKDRAGLIRSVVQLVQRLHRAGHFHGRLRVGSVFVDESGRAYLERLGAVCTAHWMPPLAREILRGLELRGLLRSLRNLLSAQEASELVSEYCRGMAQDPLRSRLLRWAIGPVSGAEQDGAHVQDPTAEGQ